MFSPRFTATPAVAEPVLAVPAAMMTPASAGPTTRAELNAMEFSAIALASRWRGTRSEASDWRIGMSTALTRPSQSAMTMTIGIWTTPDAVRTEEDERLSGRGDLRDHQGSTLVDPIGKDAAERREQHRRAELEDGDDAQLDRRAAQGEDQPGEAHLLHPGAHQAHDLAAPVEPIVAHAERLEASPQAARGGRARDGALAGCRIRSLHAHLRIGGVVAHANHHPQAASRGGGCP